MKKATFWIVGLAIYGALATAVATAALIVLSDTAQPARITLPSEGVVLEMIEGSEHIGSQAADLRGEAYTPVANPYGAEAPPTDAADDGRPARDMQLAVIVPSPRQIVFQQVGDEIRIEARGLYSDGTLSALPDESGGAVVFQSSNPDVVSVSADGLATAVAPGSAEVVMQYAGASGEAPVVVYAPIVEVPPIDPEKVLMFGDEDDTSSGGVVLNRIIVYPVGDDYDPFAARDIAADYGGDIIAEFTNLGGFTMELDIDTLDDLGDILESLISDPRVSSAEPNWLYSVGPVRATPVCLDADCE